MGIVSFQMIAELNEQLRIYGVQLKLRDACGSQLISIRTPDGEKPEHIEPAVYEHIERYFKHHFMEISYNDTKTTFMV